MGIWNRIRSWRGVHRQRQENVMNERGTAPVHSKDVHADAPHASGAVDHSPHAVYLGRLAASSAPSMASALRTVAVALGKGPAADGVNWSTLTPADLETVRVYIRRRQYSPLHERKIFSGIRGVLKAARHLGQIDLGVYDQLSQVGNGRRKTTRASIQPEARRSYPASVRGIALLAVRQDGQLPLRALTALRFHDYDPTTRQLRVFIRPLRMESVTLSRSAADAVDAWIAVRGRHDGYLFCAVTRTGRPANRGLTAQAAYIAIRAAKRNAGGR